jgi:ATP-dependent DNA ligase
VFIADGEVVTFEAGVTSFAKLQQRMQIAKPSPELRSKVPVWLYLFDLLYVDRYDIRRVPLRYRKQVLRQTIHFHDALRFTENRETEGQAYYNEACRRRWEGVIAKDGDSVYVSGRTRAWLKFKCTHEQEFVIGGYTDPRGGRVRASGVVECSWIRTGMPMRRRWHPPSQYARAAPLPCHFRSTGLTFENEIFGQTVRRFAMCLSAWQEPAIPGMTSDATAFR